MYPRLFLIAGGSVLLLLGILGYANVFTESGSPSFWLDGWENAAHAGLGLAALGVIFVPVLNTRLAPYQPWCVGALAVITLFFGVYGFLLSPGSSAAPNAFGVANLESPADNLLHLVVGIVALASILVKSNSMPTGG